MKILIIGSKGLIGKSIKKILTKKFHVTTIDIDNKKKLKNDIKLDLKKTLNFTKFKAENADIAVLFAFFKSQPKDFSSVNKNFFFNTNKKILDNSLKICKLLKIKKIIYFSSPAIYQKNYKDIKIRENFKKRPKNIYGKFKLYAENKVIDFGKDNNIIAINLRLFNYFDNKGNILIKNFQRQISKKKVVLNGNGYQKRDFLHVDDIASSIIEISKKRIKSGNYNLCSSIGVTINDIVKRYLKKKNFKIKIEYKNKYKKVDYLVGNNQKLKKIINLRVTKKFNDFILK